MLVCTPPLSLTPHGGGQAPVQQEGQVSGCQAGVNDVLLGLQTLYCKDALLVELLASTCIPCPGFKQLTTLNWECSGRQAHLGRLPVPVYLLGVEALDEERLEGGPGRDAQPHPPSAPAAERGAGQLVQPSKY